MRIYLDNCCLERPYDDQDQDRIRMEAESVVIIMRLVGRGKLTWVGSDILICESRRIRDPKVPSNRDEILSLVNELVVLDEQRDIDRIQTLVAMGFGECDAHHLAAAEKAGCDVALTTDDRFLSVAKRMRMRIQTRVENPVIWVREVIYES